MHAISIRQTALALSVLLAGVAHAAAPRVWDVPDVLEAVDVPGRTVTGGVPVTMHAVRSKQDAASLERWFRGEFERAGLWVGKTTQLTVHRQVTGLDVDTFVSYSVFLQENRDRSTTVILSETYLAEASTGGGEAPKFAPVMPGAQSVVVAHTEGTELASYRVKAKPDAVRAFYA